MTEDRDWFAWHEHYDDPSSALGQRLLIVQRHVRAGLDRQPPGPIPTISICAGQATDLIEALHDHPRRDDVQARLVELDPRNVRLAREAASEAELDGLRIDCADASLSDSYMGAVPAKLILACGVFGNISTPDITRTIGMLPHLCANEATTVWTRHRGAPDVTPHILDRFRRAGFDQVALDTTPEFSVGTHLLTASPQPLGRGVRFFEFVGYDALAQTASVR